MGLRPKMLHNQQIHIPRKITPTIPPTTTNSKKYPPFPPRNPKTPAAAAATTTNLQPTAAQSIARQRTSFRSFDPFSGKGSG